MKVLFISQYYPPESGAVQERIDAQTRHLSRKGHEIGVLTCFPNYPGGALYPGYKNMLFQRENNDGIQVFRTWSFISPKKGLFPRLAGFISFMLTSILASFMVGNYNSVIVEYPPLFVGISGYIISRLKRCNLILHVSDLWVEAGVAFGIFRNKILIFVLLWLERFLCRKADEIITVTEGCKKSLIQNNILSQKITVIPNGVNTEIYRFLGDKNGLRKRFNVEDRFIITYAGTHGYIHGVETIIQASKLLKNQRKFLFLLIGEGSEKNRIIQMAKELKLNNVKFLGQMEPKKLNKFLSISDIGIVTLRNIPVSEKALSVKMLTYMACKLPTIFSGNGISGEIVEDSNSGICTEPENPDKLVEAIMELYNNQEIRLRYGKNGRKYVESHYSRAKLAERFEEVLLGLVEGKNGYQQHVGKK